MDTSALKKVAQSARNLLIDQITAKFDLVVDQFSPARRQHPQAVRNLDNAIGRSGKAQIIEQVAYTWFNRFTALRFMDVNGYTAVGVVSPAQGQTRPEILSEAMAGNVPENAPNIMLLLDGRTPSPNPQAEAYQQLLVHTCNTWHRSMPFLFEEINDYTELLMPDDLLSQSSILARLCNVMTKEACQDVEIIGWLYQFYISEKKDEVFAGLKKNQKITAENIPAATQLFTPHWIVRYLVENSLGRLWLLNRPTSKLAAQMDYYIAPEEVETDFLKISRPEDIRICDPAVGSGHMLTYAFDLLYAIYEEEGYAAAEIPMLILTHNLTGIEIDDRAGALAAFALAMKAAAKLGRRRFLQMEVKPNICVLQNISFSDNEMQDIAALLGKDLFTAKLRNTLRQFEAAKNFGSLIVPSLRDPAEVARAVRLKDFGTDLLRREVPLRLLKILEMAEALSPKYHVVVANPPYMGTGAMNSTLKTHVGDNFVKSKADLGAVFIERCKLLCSKSAYSAMVTMQGWMFLSRYESLRNAIITESNIISLAHLGEHAFDTISGAVVSTAAYILQNTPNSEIKASFIRLTDGRNEAEKEKCLRLAASGDRKLLYYHKTSKFAAIPSYPICYWLPQKTVDAFRDNPLFGDRVVPRKGMVTADNEFYIRFHWEPSIDNIGRGCSDRTTAKATGAKWFPYNKGGERRKWYGNDYHVVNWENDGEKIQNRQHPVEGRVWATNFNLEYIFKPSLSWTDITTDGLAARLVPKGYMFDSTAWSAFDGNYNTALSYVAAICNTKVGQYISLVLNPTIHFTAGDFARFPLVELEVEDCKRRTNQAVCLAQEDWNWNEISANFTTLPLLSPKYWNKALETTYDSLRVHWQDMTDEMQRLEQENNRIFIDAYGLQDELTAEVPLNEITLTCNPAYRYSIKSTAETNEARLCADTMAEFLSYAVGCMFGRYSIDVPGLILANQGEGLADYLAKVPSPTFEPDTDNIIPVLGDSWFPDNITDRFRLFLRATFGEENFTKNLRYIEDALGKDIGKYFTKDFYPDHVKRYKKRPIYWMFSSPKGTFNALIYMHRYRSDTVSIMLNHYLRELISKMEAERGRLEKLADDPSANQGQRTKALKDVAIIGKQIDELNLWERDIIFPLAQAKIEIDLDDGVKANYPKFGAALKNIPGLEAKDD